jgi:hypothetical protein
VPNSDAPLSIFYAQLISTYYIFGANIIPRLSNNDAEGFFHGLTTVSISGVVRTMAAD